MVMLEMLEAIEKTIYSLKSLDGRGIHDADAKFGRVFPLCDIYPLKTLCILNFPKIFLYRNVRDIGQEVPSYHETKTKIALEPPCASKLASTSPPHLRVCPYSG